MASKRCLFAGFQQILRYIAFLLFWTFARAPCLPVIFSIKRMSRYNHYSAFVLSIGNAGVAGVIVIGPLGNVLDGTFAIIYIHGDGLDNSDDGYKG